jgi:putative oxidoreductase
MSGQQSDAIALAGRALMSLLFLVSGFGKLMAPSATIAYMAAQGLPVPPAAYGVSLLCEIGGGLAMLLGWQTRAVAAVLAVFCVVTAVAVHLAPENSEQMINFWKNVAIAGGFLNVLAFGGGSFSLDAWRRAPRSASVA